MKVMLFLFTTFWLSNSFLNERCEFGQKGENCLMYNVVVY